MESAETSAQTFATGPVTYSVKFLSQIESELKELLEKRESMEKNLVRERLEMSKIENSLYNLETSYIEDSVYGNIIKGYESFLTARTQHTRRQIPLESERIFSSSSVSYQRLQDSYQEPDYIKAGSYNHSDDSPKHHGNYTGVGEDDGDFVLEKNSSSSSRKKKRALEEGRRKKRVIHSDDDD